MSETIPPTTRSFQCESCHGEIQIPYDLPPTTGPCPHCRSSITSPPPPAKGPEAEAVPPIRLTPEPEEAAPAPAARVEGKVPSVDSAPLPSALPSVPRDELPGGGHATSQAVNQPARQVVGIGGAVPPLDQPAKLPEGPAKRNAPSPPGAARAVEGNKRGIHPAIPFMAAILLIVGVLVGLVLIKRKDADAAPPVVETPKKEKEPVSEEARRQFLRDGWKQYATNTLTAFLRATTPEEKAKYVLGGESRVEDMRKFYGAEEQIDEADTPIDLFTHFDLDIADKQRGLFLMQFERPTQYDMKEFFRPVAPLEVQHRVEEPGLLLSAFAARDNFAMQPLRVMAFFKEVDNKLLLDWDVYSQTKYRSLLHFTTYPQPGNSQVFRVMAREILPAVAAPGDGANLPQRYFRFSDPAHGQDHADIPVASDSLPGKILADLAFINVPNKDPQNRYATIELGWTQGEEPSLILRKLICWEFLGLGGMEGNADPVEDDPVDIPVNLDSLEPDPLGVDAPPIPSDTSLQPVSLPALDPNGEAEEAAKEAVEAARSAFEAIEDGEPIEEPTDTP